MDIEPHLMLEDEIAHVKNLTATRPTLTTGTVRSLLAHIAAQATELKQLRAAKAADRERVRGAVISAMNEPGAPVKMAAWCESIATRVADALAVPVRPELTEQERCHLLSIKSQFPHSPALWSDELATLDRLLERTQ